MLNSDSSRGKLVSRFFVNKEIPFKLNHLRNAS